MPRARSHGSEHEVRVTRDLSDNWAVEIAPIPASPRKWEPYKPEPAVLLVKLHATSRDAAARAALEQLKQQGKIDDFSV
ncbi:MAG: hypothetical protein HY901_14870 [Deltaproteobacteria bacterium]|nr:hypothetical protein [Deltaproteobacteria bacterium]